MAARAWNAIVAVTAVVAAILVICFAGVRLVGLTPYAVLSGSMEPLYPTGSLIFVAPADSASIQPGDTITFMLDSGTLVTHQVYDVDAESHLFYTQGIANKTADGHISHDAAPAPFSALVGTPVACIPYLGYANVALTTPPGIYIVISCAALIGAVTIAMELFSKDPEANQRSRGVHAKVK